MIKIHTLVPVLAAFLIAAAGVDAGTIDSRPPNILLGTGTAPLTTGGTFQADDTMLESFTLSLRDAGTAATMTAYVFGTDVSGTPDGSPLWSSTPFSSTSTLLEYSFTPGIGLTSGDQYFIGVRNVTGGQYFLAAVQNASAGSDRIVPGEFWNDGGTGTWLGFAGYDIASKIVMSPRVVPLPSAAWLGLGLLGGLGALRRIRRRKFA